MPIKNNNSIRKLISFFFEVGTLRKTLRSHRQTLLTDDLSDNIASHSYRVSMIGWFLAVAEKADPYRVIMMCLFHDLEESRSGDQNWVHKKFVKVYEKEIRESQLKSLLGAKELLKFSQEYEERKTLAAKVAKDADLLDQILILREYYWQGNKEAEIWLKGKEQEKLMSTQTGKKLAKEAHKQRPSRWWDNLWTSNRR